MTLDQQQLAVLLVDFAKLLRPDAGPEFFADIEAKAGEIARQVSEVAYGEATEAISNSINPDSLV